MPQPRKQFGQHWLRSEKALERIVAAADLKRTNLDQGIAGDRVLEIGPGTGILTRQLVAMADAVVAVEIDRDLCRLLGQKLREVDNFLLLQGDFLTLDLNTLLQPFPRFHNLNKVVANIPYNITGPILERLLGDIARPVEPAFDSIVLLLQKEVALRLQARPGSKHFGALSVRVQYLAACDWICDVPAKAFQPPPKVDSAVVRLQPRSLPVLATNPKQFGTLLKLGFANRRKMLRNNLQSVVEREHLTEVLVGLQADPQARAEELSVEQWVALSNQLTLSH